MSLRDTMAIADERLASLRMFRGHASWICFAIVVLMRSTGHPAMEGIGAALCAEIFISTSVLIYLVAHAGSRSTTKLHTNLAQDDLRENSDLQRRRGRLSACQYAAANIYLCC